MTSSVGGGSSLAKMLHSEGPVVSCVLLHCEEDEKPKTTNENLHHLMEEIQIDTTPNRNGVQKLLGGPFTFIGQYPSEGIIVIGRSDQLIECLDAEQLSQANESELRQLASQWSIETTELTKEALIQALCQSQLPLNPHVLPPPLHSVSVRGKILLMRVGAEEEEEEEEEEEVDVSMAISKAMADLKQAVSNDDFFLNYTKEEYLAFLANADFDVAAEEKPPASGDQNEEEDDEDEEEEDGDNEEDDEGEESDDEDFDPLEAGLEEKNALMQLIMGEVLAEFREVNQRGPNSEELLDLRQQVANKLGIELPEPPAAEAPRKRPASLDSPNGTTKRVKFDPSTEEPTGKTDEASKENDDITSEGNATDTKPPAE